MAVRKNTRHGLSRHLFPADAKSIVASVLTEAAHTSSLIQFSNHLLNSKGKHLKNATQADSVEFLKLISATRKQSTVSLARQAINLHLLADAPLAFVASQVPTVEVDRAYTLEQIKLLVGCASPSMALSISLAFSGGLRGMELITLAPINLVTPSPRPWLPDLFSGRGEESKFSVRGKGGLVREVRISANLAEKLMAVARPAPVRVSHRGSHLPSYFDLIAGHPFSISFGKLSMRALGFSHGAHGLRHSFAQLRREELLCMGIGLKEATLILSQELGHFDDKNTQAYLRD